MSKFDRLLERITKLDKDLRFEELRKAVEHLWIHHEWTFGWKQS